MASLVLGAEIPSQSVCVCVAGREGGCWDRQLRVPGPSPQSKEVGPSPRTTENQISPLSLLCRRASLRLSPCHHLYPSLSLGLLHTSTAPSASQTTAPGTAMLNLAPSETASRPIFHCPPVPGPQPLRERSDPIPLGQIARPPPPLTWAGLLRNRRDTGSQTGSTQLTAPGPGSIYGCLHPLLPILRNFWKVGNASGERRGSQKEKKCQRPPPNRPGSRPCACGPLSQPLGPTAPSTGWVGGLAS